MKLDLDYGYGKKEIIVPDNNLAGFFTGELTKKMPEVTFEQTFARVEKGLREIIAGKRVCVLLDDSTRFQPRDKILSALGKRLRQAGQVEFVIATGTHPPENNIALEQLVRNYVSEYNLNFGVTINASRAKEEFALTGKTTRGTEVFANKKVLQADVFLPVSGMRPHYFGGYSNPIKNFLPGVCSFETIRQNHCHLIAEENSTYGQHPWHPDPKCRQNPIVEDMLEGMGLIVKNRDVFALVFIYDEQLIWAEAGEVKTVTRAGIEMVDKLMSFKTSPTKYLIVSPGRMEDKNFYMGQRCLELTKQIISRDTEVLWIAEFSQGIAADKRVGELLKEDWEYIRTGVQDKEAEFAMYKVYRFKSYLQRVKQVYIHSAHCGQELSEIGLEVVEEPQAIIDAWLKANPQAKITVINGGNKLAGYRKGHLPPRLPKNQNSYHQEYSFSSKFIKG